MVRTKTGIMNVDVELLGTQLKLRKGQVVNLIEAINLLDVGRKRYFAMPIEGRWQGHSVLIERGEVTLC